MRTPSFRYDIASGHLLLKEKMVRLYLDKGIVHVDLEQIAPGHGAYIDPKNVKLLNEKILSRAFKKRVSGDECLRLVKEIEVKR